jgi:hypothetical protein
VSACDPGGTCETCNEVEPAEPVNVYTIPRNSKIYEGCSDGSTWFTMCHPDGLYSFCRTEKGAIVHLGVGQDLVPYEDGYKFARAEVADE